MGALGHIGWDSVPDPLWTGTGGLRQTVETWARNNKIPVWTEWVGALSGVTTSTVEGDTSGGEPRTTVQEVEAEVERRFQARIREQQTATPTIQLAVLPRGDGPTDGDRTFPQPNQARYVAMQAAASGGGDVATVPASQLGNVLTVPAAGGDGTQAMQARLQAEALNQEQQIQAQRAAAATLLGTKRELDQQAAELERQRQSLQQQHDELKKNHDHQAQMRLNLEAEQERQRLEREAHVMAQWQGATAETAAIQEAQHRAMAVEQQLVAQREVEGKLKAGVLTAMQEKERLEAQAQQLEADNQRLQQRNAMLWAEQQAVLQRQAQLVHDEKKAEETAAQLQQQGEGGGYLAQIYAVSPTPSTQEDGECVRGAGVWTQNESLTTMGPTQSQDQGTLYTVSEGRPVGTTWDDENADTVPPSAQPDSDVPHVEPAMDEGQHPGTQLWLPPPMTVDEIQDEEARLDQVAREQMQRLYEIQRRRDEIHVAEAVKEQNARAAEAGRQHHQGGTVTAADGLPVTQDEVAPAVAVKESTLQHMKVMPAPIMAAPVSEQPVAEDEVPRGKRAKAAPKAKGQGRGSPIRPGDTHDTGPEGDSHTSSDASTATSSTRARWLKVTSKSMDSGSWSSTSTVPQVRTQLRGDQPRFMYVCVCMYL